MIETKTIPYHDKAAFYRELRQDLEGFLETSALANLANAAALLKQHLPDVSSPLLNRFDDQDREGLEVFTSVLTAHPSLRSGLPI